MANTLFHASIAGISGLAFALGPSMYFTTVEDAHLYQVTDQTALILTAPVEPAIAAFLTATILEPRLLALAGRSAA